jgi:antitoxin component HigA of HigAB toxin-antitoxin module
MMCAVHKVSDIVSGSVFSDCMGVGMVIVQEIFDEQSYDAALAEAERYFDNEAAPGTSEADAFAVLLDLIAAYEARHWPIENGDALALL